MTPAERLEQIRSYWHEKTAYDAEPDCGEASLARDHVPFLLSLLDEAREMGASVMMEKPSVYLPKVNAFLAKLGGAG